MSFPMRRRRIVHVVYSFSVGGLENVIVQLVNRLDPSRFEHVVLSLTTISDFKNRITQHNVQFIELHKPPGHAVALYPKIYQLLRQIKPDVLHSCNLAALEIAPLAWAARVPLRVHAEHGWDAHDPKGANLRYQRLRRLYKPFVSHYVAVSQDIDDYLKNAIGISPSHRSLIANGVDTDSFSPRQGLPLPGCPFDTHAHWLVGTVGRMQTVKNQPLLAKAFVRLLADHPEAAQRMRLVLVGDGPLRAEVEAILDKGCVTHLAWLAGERSDVARIMQNLDCFVLPSQAEGTSCTLQEAMSSGLPVVATAVGGTPDLVEHNQTGFLVAPEDELAMAEAIWQFFSQPDMAFKFGSAARSRAIQNFGLDAMIDRYSLLFASLDRDGR